LQAKLKICVICVPYKLQLAKWQIKGIRNQNECSFYQKFVSLDVKGPTDYQLHLKGTIIDLNLIKQESYLQLV
jgi:hypothetical protein